MKSKWHILVNVSVVLLIAIVTSIHSMHLASGGTTSSANSEIVLANDLYWRGLSFLTAAAFVALYYGTLKRSRILFCLGTLAVLSLCALISLDGFAILVKLGLMRAGHNGIS